MMELLLACIAGLFVLVVVLVARLHTMRGDKHLLDFIEAARCDIVFNADRKLWGVVDQRKRVVASPNVRSAVERAEVEGFGDYL